MSIGTSTSIVITAPAAVDGRGEVATLQDAASGTFVGRLLKPSGFGGAAVRTSMDNIPEGHGAAFGNFYYAHRSISLEILLARASTWALSDARYNKLCRAWNALAADGTIVWPDNDGITKLLSFRQDQPPGDPDEHGRVVLAGVCKDPRIYANTPQTGSSPKTNNGNAGSPPTFTLTPTGGNVVLTNTTAGLGSPAVTLTVGTGYVTTGSAVTVDFGARTITQGGVLKPQAEVWPSSLWWELAAGVSNTWTVTNASSVSISFRDAYLNG